MTAYIIDAFTVTAHTDIPADLPASAVVIRSEADLAALDLSPAQRLQLWNGTPGTTALKRLPALDRLWQAIAALAPAPAPSEPEPTPALSPVAEQALAELAATARKPSRQDAVLALLRRPVGATLVEIMALTGWQKHSVRGFISGAVKKKLGFAVESHKIDGDRTYRIVEAK